jgi:hypothetical protein
MAVPFLRRSPDESVSKDAEPMLEYEKAAWTVKSLFATEGTEYTELVPPPPAAWLIALVFRFAAAGAKGGAPHPTPHFFET